MLLLDVMKKTVDSSCFYLKPANQSDACLVHACIYRFKLLLCSAHACHVKVLMTDAALERVGTSEDVERRRCGRLQWQHQQHLLDGKLSMSLA